MPEAASSYLLPLRVGRLRATELLLLSRPLEADEAQALRWVRPGALRDMPMPPADLPRRLAAVGFADVEIDTGATSFRFSARRP